jgi:histidyl-tRNA synthetase
LLAVLIDSLRAFGFTENDIVVRIGSRAPFFRMFEELPSEKVEGIMQVVDKMERMPDEKSNAALEEYNLTIDEVRRRLREASANAQKEDLAPIIADLTARGLAQYVEFDLSIVRGLAYYTGVVFEVFDRSKNERALAGGGRYDRLLSLMSDGKVDLPALGFGMGDVVLANLIDDTPHAKARLDAWLARNHACDVYVVIAKEERRIDALALVQRLRESGLRVDFPLAAAKIGKQFQIAEQLGATRAVLVGDEWPQVKVKTLATREEKLISLEELPARLAS